MPLTKNLYDLFLLDKRIQGMSGRLNAATNRLAAQQTQLAQTEQQHAEMTDQLKHLRAKAGDLEGQVAELGERIARQRELMNTVTNNKQYSALLIEVNTLKHDQSKLEDEALERMSQIEVQEQELTELVVRVGERKKLVTVAKAEVAKCQDEVGDQLDALAKDRSAAEQELPADVRQTFNRLMHVHDGEAMATVVEESRRNMEYSCGGCYLSIPVERVNVLMSHDEMVMCPNCSRLLYLDQDLMATLVK